MRAAGRRLALIKPVAIEVAAVLLRPLTSTAADRIVAALTDHSRRPGA